MNETVCSRVMDTYLALDKGERVPFSAAAHILFCKKCRREIKLLTKAEKALRAPLAIPVPLSDGTIEEVLKKIDPEFAEAENKNPIAMQHWILSGVLMIAFMLAFTFFSDRSPMLDVATSIVFASCVVAYCLIFVRGNIDFFIKKIKTIRMRRTA